MRLEYILQKSVPTVELRVKTAEALQRSSNAVEDLQSEIRIRREKIKEEKRNTNNLRLGLSLGWGR